MSWVMMRPHARVAEAIGLPATAIPVHEDFVEEIFEDRVDLVALINNLELFAGIEPNAIDRLEATVVRLYEAVVDDFVDDGNWLSAEELALRGLRWAPRHLGLKVALGRAQHGQGRHAEATTHWLAAVSMARAAQTWSPMLWLLTARALMEQEQLDAAATLLDDIADMLPEHYEFWELRSHVADRIEARDLGTLAADVRSTSH